MGVFDWFRRGPKEASRSPEASTEQAEAHTSVDGVTAGAADEAGPEPAGAAAPAGEAIGIPKQQSKQEADAAREPVRETEQEPTREGGQEAVQESLGAADSETDESARR
ncbi:hypothetical protein [Streptomyces sp. NPDC097640]|uniref:hypothetical protein n=1 Tax=Streptomyces sp. NPDC097640 TaxID=3157229 RepID=UPI0033234C8E